MLAKKYNSKIISIINPLEDVYTLEFESKLGSYKYNPGQFLHLAIDDSYDGVGQWPDSRCFSMQSSPDEKTLVITYAVKGKFTRRMKHTLEVGSNVWLKLAYGDLFTQPHSKENTVFIAGGTGITPFLSLFKNKIFEEYCNPHIYLGYRSKAHQIYEEELNKSYNSSKSIECFYENIDGVIDIAKILEENNSQSDFFISGPPQMIYSFKTYLLGNGVPSKNVKTDDWG